MKNSKITVSISEPCHEDWNQMTATEKGKFCKSCTKEVIDFTNMTDERVFKYLHKNEDTCGRFYASQLDRKLF